MKINIPLIICVVVIAFVLLYLFRHHTGKTVFGTCPSGKTPCKGHCIQENCIPCNQDWVSSCPAGMKLCQQTGNCDPPLGYCIPQNSIDCATFDCC